MQTTQRRSDTEQQQGPQQQAAPVLAALQSNQAMQELAPSAPADSHAAANDLSGLAVALGAAPFAPGLGSWGM